MNRIEQLERLARMHEDGVLTNEEYAREKDRLLASSKGMPLRRALLLTCVAAAVALSGLISWNVIGANQESEVAPQSETPPPINAASSVTLRSKVAGLRFVTLEQLPDGPRSEVDAYCQIYVADFTTAAARLTAEKGWTVTGELSLGPYTAVSFVGSLEPGTSGACFPNGGNVAMFAGDQLVGLAYATNENDQPIMRIDAASDSNRVRIIPGVNLPPLADILAEDGRLSVVPLPASESHCEGSVVVPNIFGEMIDRARNQLRANGWRPKVTVSDEEREIVQGRGQDIPEVVFCSGTGYGLCEFTYSHPNGPELSVGTFGDDMAVNGYDVSCHPGSG